jgi:hypothetical protein
MQRSAYRRRGELQLLVLDCYVSTVSFFTDFRSYLTENSLPLLWQITARSVNVGIRIKCVIFSDFDQNWTVSTNFSNNLKYDISRKAVRRGRPGTCREMTLTVAVVFARAHKNCCGPTDIYCWTEHANESVNNWKHALMLSSDAMIALYSRAVKDSWTPGICTSGCA